MPLWLCSWSVCIWKCASTPTTLKKVTKLLVTRYTFGIILAFLFYFFMPLPDIVVLSLVLLALAPVGTVATINIIAYGNKRSLASFLASVSIIVSLTLMTLALMLIL
ncbi:MAG: hypothetical protein U5K84_04485 [Alkalibacterium sp.]|nr:hypothetical protein [Alkalibacterium sp.]